MLKESLKSITKPVRKCWDKDSGKLFVGALGGIAVTKLVKTQKAKDLAVKTVASGIKAKENLDRTVEDLRNQAEDTLAEAQAYKEEQEKKKAEEEAGEDLEDLAEENGEA